MRCSLCNRDLIVKNVEYKGSFINVCRNCEDYALERIEEKRVVSKFVKDSEEVIDNLGVLIMRKRMQMELKQEELAQKLGIKASLLAKIESGKIEIDLNLVRRLERILGVRLIDHI